MHPFLCPQVASAPQSPSIIGLDCSTPYPTGQENEAISHGCVAVLRRARLSCDCDRSERPNYERQLRRISGEIPELEQRVRLLGFFKSLLMLRDLPSDYLLPTRRSFHASAWNPTSRERKQSRESTVGSGTNYIVKAWICSSRI